MLRRLENSRQNIAAAIFKSVKPANIEVRERIDAPFLGIEIGVIRWRGVRFAAG